MPLLLCLISGCGGKSKDKNDKTGTAKTTNIAVDAQLKQRLADFSTKPRVNGKFAFYVYDLTAGKPVFGCNEHLAIPCASCLKLLTGVAGLHLLGTNYYYATSIYTRGKVVDGTLQGDIGFKGELDPQFNEPDMATLVKAIRALGIRKITGKVIVDLIITEPVKSEQHWYPWDLSFSKYGLLFKGGDRVSRTLKHNLRAQGIAVADSQMTMGHVRRSFHCVKCLKRPIEPIIKKMWKNSSNTQATSLLYAIGHRADPKKEPTQAGVEYLRKFLREDLGQRDSALVIHDGCGLCTYNHMSPLALTAVLRYGYQHLNIRKMLMNNLAISGVDGTLMRLISHQKVRGKIHAKTGTLSHPYGISSLAGFCQGSNGHWLAFAIEDTEMSVLDAHELQKKLCYEMTK